MAQIQRMDMRFFDIMDFDLYEIISVEQPEGFQVLLWDGRSNIPDFGNIGDMDVHLILEAKQPLLRDDLVLLQKKLRNKIRVRGVFVDIPEKAAG